MSESTQKLRSVNEEYFDLLEQHFLQERERFGKLDNLEEVGHLARSIVSDNQLIIVSAKRHSTPFFKVERLLDDVVTFWKTRAKTYLQHLRNLDSYQISTFVDPENIERIVTFLGVYFDHVTFNDPLLMQWHTLLHQVKRVHEQQFAYTTLCYYLQMLFNKELFLPQKGEPIAIVTPRLVFVDETIESELEKEYYSDGCEILSRITDRELSSFEEAAEYLIQREPDEVIKNKQTWHDIMGPELQRVRLGSEATLAEYNQATAEQHYAGTGATFYGWESRCWLLYSLISMTRQVSMLDYDSRTFNLDPFVPRQLWGVYKWHIQKSSRTTSALLSTRVDDAQLFSLAVQHRSLDWLSKLSLNEVYMLREKLEDVRETFRAGRQRVKLASLSQLEDTVRSYSNEIESKLDKHETEIRETLQKRKSQMIKGAVGLLVTASISAATVLFPQLAIPGALASVAAGGKSIKDLVEAYMVGGHKLKELQQRPLGVLLRVKGA